MWNWFDDLLPHTDAPYRKLSILICVLLSVNFLLLLVFSITHWVFFKWEIRHSTEQEEHDRKQNERDKRVELLLDLVEGHAEITAEKSIEAATTAKEVGAKLDAMPEKTAEAVLQKSGTLAPDALKPKSVDSSDNLKTI